MDNVELDKETVAVADDLAICVVMIGGLLGFVGLLANKGVMFAIGTFLVLFALILHSTLLPNLAKHLRRLP